MTLPCRAGALHPAAQGAERDAGCPASWNPAFAGIALEVFRDTQCGPSFPRSPARGVSCESRGGRSLTGRGTIAPRAERLGRQRTCRRGSGPACPARKTPGTWPGKAQFVGDLSFPRLWEVAFVRSPLAHARIRAVIVPERYGGRVFTANDMEGVRPIRAESSLPTYKASDWPALARDKVRFAGECIALCIAPTRGGGRGHRRGGGARPRTAARGHRQPRRPPPPALPSCTTSGTTTSS